MEIGQRACGRALQAEPKMSGAGQDRWGSAIYLTHTRTRTRQQGNILISGASWEGIALQHSAIMSCSVQSLNKEHPAAKQAPSLPLSTTVRATARRKVDRAGIKLGLPLVQQQTRLHILMQR